MPTLDPMADKPESDNREEANVTNASSSPNLSEREIEILHLVATGASNKEIAQQLIISPNTVKVHVRNIFAKIGVASRTEATLYAIRNGLVQVSGSAASEEPIEAEAEPASPENSRPTQEAAAGDNLEAPGSLPASASQGAGRRTRYLRLAGGLALLLLIIGGAIKARDWLSPTPPPTVTPPALPSSASRCWEAEANMPAARSGFGIAAYEDRVYIIAGETPNGVTGAVERYDAQSDAWKVLVSKPTSVTEVSAAVIGGRIYVPGGRLASGARTNVLEVYDPRTDRWEQRAPVPELVSAYALAAFEGKLYLIGGWDGQHYLDAAYVYEPGQDAWQARTAMPTARGFAAAAVVGGSIYVIGGRNANRTLDTNEEYAPARDENQDTPWTTKAPLPEARWGLGAIGIADIIQVVGGDGCPAGCLALRYSPSRNAWYQTEMPKSSGWTGLGVAVVGSKLYAFGGNQDNGLSQATQACQVIFTTLIPIIQQ